MFLINFCNFIACQCDSAGSRHAACDIYGRCTCKAGYIGKKCDVCAAGLYRKWDGFRYICSGISALVVSIFLALLWKFKKFLKTVQMFFCKNGIYTLYLDVRHFIEFCYRIKLNNSFNCNRFSWSLTNFLL